MKWFFSLLPISLVIVSASASPIVTRQDDGLPLFKLKIASSSKQLDGSYLSINDSELGIYTIDDVEAVRVYQSKSQKAGCTQLHTYPIGIVDHSIGLVGPPSLMTIVDAVNPKTDSDPEDGKVALFDTFRMSEGRVTNDSPGRWVAFPDAGGGSWTVKWYDDEGITTQDFLVVEIHYEEAGFGRYG